MSSIYSDRPSLERVVLRCGRKLYRSAWLLAQDADAARDLVQETFLEACKSWNSFEGKSSPYTWLYRIMLRRWSRWRRKTRAQTTEPLDAENARCAGSGPAELAGRLDAQIHVQKAIAELPSSHRAVIVMKYYEEWSSEQIADALGISPGRARARLAEARRMLRDRLASMLGEARDS